MMPVKNGREYCKAVPTISISESSSNPGNYRNLKLGESIIQILIYLLKRSDTTLDQVSFPISSV